MPTAENGISVKLRIATRHILPSNNQISLFDTLSEKTADMTTPAWDTEIMEAEDMEMSGEDASPEGLTNWLETMIDRYFTHMDEENTGRFIFTTEANMHVTPGEITISYEESPDNQLGQTHSTLRIPRNTNHMLSIERTGTLINTLICETGRRHVSVYHTPMLPGPVEICTCTRRCDIDLDEDGGVILLDYIIEIRGADVQRTTIRMDVTPLG